MPLFIQIAAIQTSHGFRTGELLMSVADTPEPPYYAAIFSSIRAPGDETAYEAMGQAMAALAMQQPGFLGFEFGADTPDRFSVFVSYWRSDDDIRRWSRSPSTSRRRSRAGRGGTRPTRSAFHGWSATTGRMRDRGRGCTVLGTRNICGG